MRDLNKKVREKFENFFDWIKGAELVELKHCNPKEDPIRPELNNDFRTSYGRKIYGVKFKNESLRKNPDQAQTEIVKIIES